MHSIQLVQDLIMHRVLGQKRKFGEVELAEEKKKHAYECVIYGAVKGPETDALLKRINVLCDDLADKTHGLCMLESVYADNRSMQQLRVRCQQEPSGKQSYSISLLGNFHRGKDLPSPTRSSMEAAVSKGIYDFLNSLGMKFLFETARKGSRFITRDGVKVEAFRIVQAASMSKYLKDSAAAKGGKQAPPQKLAFIVPGTTAAVGSAPMLIRLSSKAQSEEDLPATSAGVRSFARKLGPKFEEIKPADYT